MITNTNQSLISQPVTVDSITEVLLMKPDVKALLFEVNGTGEFSVRFEMSNNKTDWYAINELDAFSADSVQSLSDSINLFAFIRAKIDIGDGTYAGHSGSNYIDGNASLTEDLTDLDTQVKTNEDNISSNLQSITTLQSSSSTQSSDITTLQSDVTSLQNRALSSLSDVSLNSPADGQSLVWNSNLNSWDPQTITGGSGGGASGINHIQESDAEAALTIWSESHDGSFDITSDAVTVLRGLKSFKLAKAAADQSTKYIQVTFSVPNADLAKKHLISFDYDASHANYSDNDIRLSIIKDPSGTPVEIRINGEDLKAGKGTHYAQFQTDATETSYALRFTINSTNASAFDVFLDTVKVSPVGVNDSVSNQEVFARIAGVVTTNNANVVPTSNYTTNIKYKHTEEDTTASYDSSTGIYTVPETGIYTITASALMNFNGGWDSASSNPDEYFILALYVDGTQKFVEDRDSEIAGNTQRYIQPTLTQSLRLTKGQEVEIRVIQNSGIDQSIADSGTYTTLCILKSPSLSLPESVGSGRDIVCSLQGLSGNKVINNAQDTLIDNWNTPAIDTVGGWDAVNQYYVVPETGYYDIDFSVLITNDANFDLSRVVVMIKQGTNVLKYSGNRGSGVDYNYADVSKTAAYLEKGQTISFFVRQDQLTSPGEQNDVAASAIYTNASIAKRQSAQTVLETETVAARYYLDTEQTNVSLSGTISAIFDTKEFDTHNCVFNLGQHGTKLVAPVSGYYMISAGISIADVDITSDAYVQWRINVDPAATSRTYNHEQRTRLDSVRDTSSFIWYLEKGDQVGVYLQSTDTSVTLQSGSALNWISFARLK
jgi:hypothetical protein